MKFINILFHKNCPIPLFVNLIFKTSLTIFHIKNIEMSNISNNIFFQLSIKISFYTNKYKNPVFYQITQKNEKTFFILFFHFLYLVSK